MTYQTINALQSPVSTIHFRCNVRADCRLSVSPSLFPSPGPGCEDPPLYLEVQFHCGANMTKEARETEEDKEDKIGNMGENISKVTNQRPQ